MFKEDKKASWSQRPFYWSSLRQILRSKSCLASKMAFDTSPLPRRITLMIIATISFHKKISAMWSCVSFSPQLSFIMSGVSRSLSLPLRPHCRIASVDLEVRAVDECGVFAEKESNSGRNLRGFPVPSRETALFCERPELLSRSSFGLLRRPNEARGHGVHTDLVHGKVQCHVLGQDVYGAFCCGVGPALGLWAMGRNAADVDDGCVVYGSHVGMHGARGIDAADDVDAVAGQELLRCAVEAHGSEIHGGVHEEMNRSAAVLPCEWRHGLFHRFAIADVARIENQTAAVYAFILKKMQKEMKGLKRPQERQTDILESEKIFIQP